MYSNGVVANKDITVDFQHGEIHSIVGENGAGKSTLMKILFGIETPSAGKVILRGNEVHFANSLEAIKAGILAMVRVACPARPQPRRPPAKGTPALPDGGGRD